MTTDIELLKYPIGKYQRPEIITQQHISEWLDRIERLPGLLKEASAGLTDKQLDTPYREGGWTLRQVIHHIADSHINAYVRFKLTMTEDNPIIKPYFEAQWAECEEAKNAGIKISLDLIENLHRRWVMYMHILSFEDLDRSYIHPEHNTSFNLKTATGLYAWHGEHHLNHILHTKKLQKWQ